MANENAVPQCFIQIYPFEGGSYFLQGGAPLLAATVTKSIREVAGTFQLTLAPSGPMGVNNSPTWAEIITPMSLALIGFARGSHRRIVMIGVVLTISEMQEWQTDGQVLRTITVTGQDFGYFFSTMSWLSLTFLTSLGAAAGAVSEATGGPASAGVPQLLSGALLSGTPASMAKAWFTQIMAGTNVQVTGTGQTYSGVFSNTQFPYGSQRVTFPQAMASWFQEYPGFTIPFGDYFLASETTWYEKFRAILPFPWYEFFIDTAPLGGGNAAALYPSASGGTGFMMNGVGAGYPASPIAVGRINPTPYVPVSVNGRSITFQAINVSAWNGLPLFQLDSSFIDSGLTFDASDVRNFYFINPLYFKTLFGESNDNVMSFIYTFVGAIDAASVHRYGYRPIYADSRWMSDLLGSAAENSGTQNSVFSLVADLTAKLTSWYEPTALMAKTSVRTVLRPDIMIGTRFRYSPFKSNPIYPTWDFYIESVTHEFRFGATTTTTLGLARGLPTAVYQSTAQGGLLTQAHLGNAQRLNGVYQVGLPAGLGAPLASVDLVNDASIAAVFGTINQAQTTPQGY